MKYLTLLLLLMFVGCGSNTESVSEPSEPTKAVSEGLYVDKAGTVYSVEFDANGNPLPIIGDSDAGPYFVNFEEIYPLPMPMGDG